MRALFNVKAGSPEVLSVKELPDSPPQPGEVRIAVKRAGLNFADIAARMGLYPDAPPFPMVMGYEVSGHVDAVGTGIDDVALGESVLAMCRFGGQADKVKVPRSQVHRLPPGMSFDEGAALPVNGLTAFHMLMWVAPIRPGMTVLIHSVGGGVGQMAVQVCRTVPDITIIGTASKWKHELLKSTGVDFCIDSREEDYGATVRSITRGRGVDRILDALGGADWKKGYELLAPGGHLHCYGWANMISGSRRSLPTLVREYLQLRRYSPMELMDKNRGLSGTNMGHLWNETALMNAHMEKLLSLYVDGKIKPKIDTVFPLERAAEAHRHLQDRKNVGKVLLACSE